MKYWGSPKKPVGSCSHHPPAGKSFAEVFLSLDVCERVVSPGGVNILIKSPGELLSWVSPLLRGGRSPG